WTRPSTSSSPGLVVRTSLPSSVRRKVGDVPGSRPERQRDAEVGVVVDLQRPRHALFGGPAVVVAEALGDVADPGRDDAGDAAGADHLVEEAVRDGTDQRQVAPAL